MKVESGDLPQSLNKAQMKFSGTRSDHFSQTVSKKHRFANGGKDTPEQPINILPMVISWAVLIWAEN